MTMTMNLIAMLLSFAMMLTGVGGEGQPAEASRTLALHDVRLYINDETLDLDPELLLKGLAIIYDKNRGKD